MTMAIAAATTEIAQAGENSGQAVSPKLVKAAHDFEAILLQSWLEKMNQSFVGESGSLDAAHDTVSSLGTQAIAKALAARGGIGIAAMVLRQLAPRLGSEAKSGEQVEGDAAVNRDREPGR